MDDFEDVKMLHNCQKRAQIFSHSTISGAVGGRLIDWKEVFWLKECFIDSKLFFSEPDLRIGKVDDWSKEVHFYPEVVHKPDKSMGIMDSRNSTFSTIDHP